MKFQLILILSLVTMITDSLAARTSEEQAHAILNRINKAKEPSKCDWKPSGPTVEDIQASNKTADQSTGFFSKRDLGVKLKRAVENGNLIEVKNLIAASADLEIEDYWGTTSLMIAAKKGYTDIVNMLINAGANVDAQEHSGSSTALFYALDKGHTEIAKLLIAQAKDSCNLKALTTATEKSNTEIVRLLIAKGAAKKYHSEFQNLFINAVSRGDNEMVKALMTGGASIDNLTLIIASTVARKSCYVEIVNAIQDIQKKNQPLISEN